MESERLQEDQLAELIGTNHAKLSDGNRLSYAFISTHLEELLKRIGDLTTRNDNLMNIINDSEQLLMRLKNELEYNNRSLKILHATREALDALNQDTTQPDNSTDVTDIPQFLHR